MNRYKEKYAGTPSGQPTAGDKRPHDAARKKGPTAGTQPGAVPSGRPGILDRIKRLFGVGKDRE